MPNLLPVSYKGASYRTVIDLCRALDRLDDYSMIYTRIKRGWTADQAVDVAKAMPRSIGGSVYLLTCVATGERYVGITTVSIEERWLHHVSNAKRHSSPLATAISKHGAQSFTRRTLEEGVPADMLADRERHWIDRFETRVPHGLNANGGGALGGRRGTGFNDKVAELVLSKGMNPNTARGWVRKGRSADRVRRYERHGNTGHPLYKSWRGMCNRGGVCSEWQSFDRFVADITPFKSNRRFERVSNKEPWSLGNLRKS